MAASLFAQLVEEAPFTLKEWAKLLHTTERTLRRHLDNDQSFAPLQADRIIKLAEVVARGEEVFGDLPRFEGYLRSTIPALNNQQPLSLLDASAGINQVLAAIGRIEHGILA